MPATPEQQPSPPDARPNAQTRLAIERTLLAWIRTGLAMMGFGFVLDRFGFYLRELSRASHVGVRSIHVSFWSGILLIAVGAAVNFGAAVLSYPVLMQARRGEKDLPATWRLGLALAVLTAVGGAAIAVLLFVTGPAEGAEMPAAHLYVYRERSHTMHSDQNKPSKCALRHMPAAVAGVKPRTERGARTEPSQPETDIQRKEQLP